MATVLDQLVTVLSFRNDDRGLKKASAGLAKVKKRAKETAKSFLSLRKIAVGAMGAIGAAMAAKALVSKVVEVNKTFQGLKASLKTVTGSAAAASIAFQGIRKFARETPFTVAKVTSAFVKLKALGLDPSEAALRSYGNTASAMGKTLSDVIEAVADASTGEFERLKEFGIKARSQGDQVAFTFQGVTTTVGKNAREIEAYIRGIGDVQFAGAMADQMGTLGGAFSNLEDSTDSLFVAIGEGGLNAAILEASLTLAGMAEESGGLGKVLGEVLGDIVREGTKLLKDFGGTLRSLKRSDVRSWLRRLGGALKTSLDVLALVVKHWDKFLAILAGAKMAQGFSAAAAGLKGMGIAASSSLGPIGLIAAALVALIPIALEAGEALGDVLAKKKGIARADKKTARSNLDNIVEVGKLGPEGAAIAKARSQATLDLNAAEGDVERLSSRQDLAYRPELKRELAAARARSKKARSAMRGFDKRAKDLIGKKADERTVTSTLEAIQKGRVDRDMAERTAVMAREDDEALVASVRGSKRRRAKALAAGRKVLSSGGSLEDAKAAAGDVRGPKGSGGKKKDDPESEAARKIESRIAELVKQSELSSFLKRTDLKGDAREAAALAAGRAKKESLNSAVSEGRLSALGGEFAQGGTSQLLRDAGILPDNQNASPPVLTVTIIKADVRVDAPIDVRVKKTSASVSDLKKDFRAGVKSVLREEVGAAIEGLRPTSRR